ncbi:hypothetical protein MTR67_004632 [Solanum verrucosum]|uniref:Uncharacterized protein n=1 Tax=Solanum verrucosum TaxID=315347 RepID=A0AAF0PUS7_SOLVR|nr:hypothetical protein MTR67_004632 [Solanum verrucosum]
MPSNTNKSTIQVPQRYPKVWYLWRLAWASS